MEKAKGDNYPVRYDAPRRIPTQWELLSNAHAALGPLYWAWKEQIEDDNQDPLDLQMQIFYRNIIDGKEKL